MKLKHYKCMLFDYDDTIVQSKPHRRPALVQILGGFGYTITETDFEKAYGKPFADFTEILAPGIDFNNFMEACAKELAKRPAPVLPGARHLLSHIGRRGLPTAIITSSHTALVKIELRAHELDGFFKHIAGTDGRGAVKPDPAALLEVMDLLFVKPEETVYIGDSQGDMAFAHAAGIDFLGVCAGGVTTKQEFIAAGLNPNSVLNDLSEAIRAL